MYDSVETMRAGFAKASSPPRVGSDRERALHALIRLEKGYMLKRDPDNGNTMPLGEAAGLPRREPTDVWQDLAAVKCPTMVVHALRSDRLDAKTPWPPRQRIQADHDHEVDCRHDIPERAAGGAFAGACAQVPGMSTAAREHVPVAWADLGSS